MELHFAYPSTYSQKVLIGLYHAGVDFVPKQVSLMDEAAREEYRGIYPIGKIPLLIRDDGRLVPESTIILEYVNDLPQCRDCLIPADRELARQVRFYDRMCDQYLNEPVVNMIYESIKSDNDHNTAVMKKSTDMLAVLYRLLDEQLAHHDFIVGDTFTLADCAAIPPLYYARSFAEFSIFENIGAYWERIQDNPAWSRVHDEAVPYIKSILGE